MNEKQTILVTGGAGFIGSHTVLELLNAGFDVICVDNLCNAFQDSEESLPESLKRVQALTGKHITFINVDIRDRDALDQNVFQKYQIDCVAHFAALKAVGESCQRPLQYYQNNITGTSVLLETMVAHNVFKLVYSSSATVYGDPEFLPLTEDHPTGKCTNPYGKSKFFTEEILKDLCTSDERWAVISLRYFNPIGAHPSGQIGEDPNGIPNNLTPYIAQVAVGRRDHVNVFGNDYPTKDGTGVRDYIHVVDLALGHVCALKKFNAGTFKGFVAYNLGTGSGTSVLEMVEAFAKASGQRVPYKICPRRPGDVATSYADCKLAETALGWRAERGIQQMCEDAWRWQKLNPNGFATNSPKIPQPKI